MNPGLNIVADIPGWTFLVADFFGLIWLIEGIHTSQRRWISVGYAILGVVGICALGLILTFILATRWSCPPHKDFTVATEFAKAHIKY